MEDYRTIPLPRLLAIIERLRVEADQATRRLHEASKRERVVQCEVSPEGPGCGPNPLGYKYIFGASESDLRRAQEEKAQAFREQVAAQSNYHRAQAAYDRRLLGLDPHPSTLGQRKPEDVPVPTFGDYGSVPCSVFDEGYEYCDKYGLLTKFTGIKTPPECLRRAECGRKGSWKTGVVIAVVAVVGLVAIKGVLK